jgi:hypothetical protein
MEQNDQKTFLININLVFLVWVLSLLFLAIFQASQEKSAGRQKKFPGINLKEF